MTLVEGGTKGRGGPGGTQESWVLISKAAVRSGIGSVSAHWRLGWALFWEAGTERGGGSQAAPSLWGVGRTVGERMCASTGGWGLNPSSTTRWLCYMGKLLTELHLPSVSASVKWGNCQAPAGNRRPSD